MAREGLPTKLTARLSDSITDLLLNFDTMLTTSDRILRAAHTFKSLDLLATVILSKCSALLSFSVYIGNSHYCIEDNNGNDTLEGHIKEEQWRVVN